MNNRRLPRTFALLAASGLCFISSHAIADELTATTAQTTAKKPKQAEAESEAASLADQLQKIADDSAKKLPPQMLKTFQKGIETVEATGVERMAKNVGDKAADARLSSWKGDPVQLSALWKEGPIVLMWYRGGW